MNNADLRALVARMHEQVVLVSAASAPASEADKRELARVWDSLVQRLALGPAPDTRDCPQCARTIMRAATLCGYCWTKPSAGNSNA